MTRSLSTASATAGRWGSSAVWRYQVGHVEVEALAQPGGLRALGRSQRREQLQLRTRRVVSDSQRGRGLGDADHEQRGGLGLRQAGEPGAVAVDQAEAAGAALLGVDRHTGGRERLDVAVDGAQRHLELARELPAGHLTAGLQQQEERHQAARSHVSRR